jgi:hypothetical protein
MGDRVSLDEAGQQALAEQLHDRVGIPCLERQKLSPLPEDPAQEAWHREDDVTVRDRLEHLLLQPLRPQELLLLFA